MGEPEEEFCGGGCTELSRSGSILPERAWARQGRAVCVGMGGRGRCAGRLPATGDGRGGGRTTAGRPFLFTGGGCFLRVVLVTWHLTQTLLGLTHILVEGVKYG
jgi:hypothetical protein